MHVIYNDIYFMYHRLHNIPNEANSKEKIELYKLQHLHAYAINTNIIYFSSYFNRFDGPILCDIIKQILQ